jgi:hypothetical protein
MTSAEQSTLAGKLAVAAAETGIKAFLAKISKAIKTKGITFEKVLRIYVVVNKAVKDVEAIIAEK